MSTIDVVSFDSTTFQGVIILRMASEALRTYERNIWKICDERVSASPPEPTRYHGVKNLGEELHLVCGMCECLKDRCMCVCVRACVFVWVERC